MKNRQSGALVNKWRKVSNTASQTWKPRPQPRTPLRDGYVLQNPTGNCSVRLVDGFCLEFAANHVKNPLDKNKNVDWKKVSRIQVVRIGKCHD